MTEEQVREAIERAIRLHEIRVAVGSGFVGLLLLAGTWHAILILK